MCAELRSVEASNNRDHARNLLLLLARATHMMVLFFTHIPFLVNHTINATPRERLQHYQSELPDLLLAKGPFEFSPEKSQKVSKF